MTESETDTMNDKTNCPSKKCNAPSRFVRIAVKVLIIPWITSLYSNGPSI